MRFPTLLSYRSKSVCLFFFFFNDTATTEIYTLSLHDALPISICISSSVRAGPGPPRAFGRSAPVIGAIELTARRTPTPPIPPPPLPPPPLPWPPTPPPPLPPPPPPPPPPTLRLSEATLLPPLDPGVLLANKEPAEGRPPSSAASRRASAPTGTQSLYR